MTGHGRGESSTGGLKVIAELASVNRKQSEVVISVPRGLDALESRARELVNRRIARGRLTARFSLQAKSESETARAHLNLPLARAYAKEMTKLAKDLGLPDRPTLGLLINAPGVLQAESELSESDGYWPAFETALTQGLDRLTAMREREGAHLSKELARLVTVMRQCLGRIRTAAAKMGDRYRQQLRERIAKVRGEVPDLDDERLAKEVVYLVDRSDITEEIARLESHFQQFKHAQQSSEPVGRTLDFLAQEMNREINTIGSKSADAEISKETVLFKTELEKFREQAQNVE